jgi:hypothetical protein
LRVTCQSLESGTDRTTVWSGSIQPSSTNSRMPRGPGRCRGSARRAPLRRPTRRIRCRTNRVEDRLPSGSAPWSRPAPALQRAFVTCTSRIHRATVGFWIRGTYRVREAGEREQPRARENGAGVNIGVAQLAGRIGKSGSHVVLVGDSAGGYLVFAVASRPRELGWPSPAGIVAMSPLTDTSPSMPLFSTAGKDIPVVTLSFQHMGHALSETELPVPTSRRQSGVHVSVAGSMF